MPDVRPSKFFWFMSQCAIKPTAIHRRRRNVFALQIKRLVSNIDIPKSRIQCHANIPKSRVQCHANVTSPDSWWRHQMETFPLYWPGKFTGHRWIPLKKACDAELWFSLICAWTKRSVAKVPNFRNVFWLVNVCSFQFLGGWTATILLAQGSTARAETSLFIFETS